MGVGMGLDSDNTQLLVSRTTIDNSTAYIAGWLR